MAPGETLINSCDLFTPGRVCLFGEHSDWAAGYGEHNGYCLVIGADQGLRAVAAKSPDSLRVWTHLPDHPDGRPATPRSIEVGFSDAALERVVEDQDEFFRYCTGAALVMKRLYKVGGIDLRIDRMDLPLKKGVSSSAAVCVLVVSAFDRLYKLGLFPHEIMELAFQGERLTGSRCGRMDQACIFGKMPVLLKFTAASDDIRIDPIFASSPVHMFFVDLAGHKDTVAILNSLRGAYTTSKSLRSALGELNESIVRRACALLSAGDAADLGELMSYAQEIFDRDIAPHCLSELGAPLLHLLLADDTLGELCYGGKGVGSGGDGSAQFVAKNIDCRQRAFEYIEKKYPQMRCFTLDAGGALSAGADSGSGAGAGAGAEADAGPRDN